MVELHLSCAMSRPKRQKQRITFSTSKIAFNKSYWIFHTLYVAVPNSYV